MDFLAFFSFKSDVRNQIHDLEGWFTIDFIARSRNVDTVRLQLLYRNVVQKCNAFGRIKLGRKYRDYRNFAGVILLCLIRSIIKTRESSRNLY